MLKSNALKSFTVIYIIAVFLLFFYLFFFSERSDRPIAIETILNNIYSPSLYLAILFATIGTILLSYHLIKYSFFHKE